MGFQPMCRRELHFRGMGYQPMSRREPRSLCYNPLWMTFRGQTISVSRLAVNFLVLLSALLLFFFSALWVQSYWRIVGLSIVSSDRAVWTTAGSRNEVHTTLTFVSIQSIPDGLHLHFRFPATTPPPAWRQDRLSIHLQDPIPTQRYRPPLPPQTATQCRLLGVNLTSQLINDIPVPAPYRTPALMAQIFSIPQRDFDLLLPYWQLILAASILPVRACIFHRRRRLSNRLTSCLCPTCNYDLRATPDRCPECGTMRSTTPNHP
jgi:hypothetical protein